MENKTWSLRAGCQISTNPCHLNVSQPSISVGNLSKGGDWAFSSGPPHPQPSASLAAANSGVLPLRFLLVCPSVAPGNAPLALG